MKADKNSSENEERLLDDDEDEESTKPKKDKNDVYKNYKKYIKELSDLEKLIKSKLLTYKNKASSQENTIAYEREIKENLRQFNEKLSVLENAYSYKNAPSGYPEVELDRRQKVLQKFRIENDNMKKQYNDIEHIKYSFKGSRNDEDYSQKEEFNNVGSDELLFMQKKKIEQQNEQLDDIVLDVKKNTVLAKNVNHVIKEQNKKIDEINEDIDQTDDKMKTLTGRFKNYAMKRSWCCLVVILLLELIIAIAAYYLLVVY